MLDEDSQADEDEDDAADDLHPASEQGAEASAEVQTNDREGGCDKTDHQSRLPDGDAEQRERQAHCEGVDAGCDRE